MNRAVSYEMISEYIKRINGLIKKLEFRPLATVLTTDERKKLYDFFFTYGMFGSETKNFGDYRSLKNQADIDEYNKKISENLNEEISALISKCGVDPHKVYILKNNSCQMDSALQHAMEAQSITEVGPYTIVLSRRHPIDRESADLKSFGSEFLQLEKLAYYQDGAAIISVWCNIDGHTKEIYHHFENMHYGDFVNFDDVQISGYGTACWISGGQMQIAIIDVTQLMSFFQSFEKLLTEYILLKNANELKGHSKKIVQG